MAKKFTPPTRQALIDAGISTGHASELAAGKHDPSLKLAVMLEDKLRIPARWWIDRRQA